MSAHQWSKEEIVDRASFRARLNSILTVDLIISPMPLTLAAADTASGVADQMRRTGFDVLPLDETIQQYWVHPNASPFTEGSEPLCKRLSAADLIASTTPALEVLRLMVEQDRRFYFVLRAASISGLVTYSDLDKRPVRSAVYALVNALDQALFAIVDLEHGSDCSYLHWLTPYERTQLKHAWERAREGDVNLSPLHYATFAQLTKIAYGSQRIRRVLEECLGPDWLSEMHVFRRHVRNPVSHASNPLVTSVDDVPRLWQGCLFGERALEALSRLPVRPVSWSAPDLSSGDSDTLRDTSTDLRGYERPYTGAAH